MRVHTELQPGRHRHPESRERLTPAYVQFVGSLAQAPGPAQDAYTAGHSRRVSEYSCAIAISAWVFRQPDLEAIRIGALLHDLGKIGISDTLSLLPKPGR